MGYRVHCNWCGTVLHDTDQAVLEVVIHREADGTELGQRWAKEVKPTLHFCVAPRNADEYNRMGLEEPDEQEAGSCFTRAMAVLDSDGLERPDMGMEWRLMPVEEDATTAERPDEYSQRRNAWRRIARPDRERLALDLFGKHRLTIRELTGCFVAALPECEIHEGDVRNVVRHLFEAGELERTSEPQAPGSTAIRYRYQRNDLPAPSAAVDADLRAALVTLPPRCRYALPRAGVTTVEQFLAMSNDDLLAIPGVGWKTIGELRDALAARNPADQTRTGGGA